MTTHAPARPIPAPPLPFARPDDRQETLAHDPAGELVYDSAPLLDHRTRRGLCSPGLASRGAYLAFKDGAQTLLHPLKERITHIGRGTSAEIRIEEQRVSRDHAIVVSHGRYARLLDNRSSNGTFLNGRGVIATNLRDGDVIRLGPVVLQYVEIR
jgi:hypothetical protein